jgi:hypothetical protein
VSAWHSGLGDGMIYPDGNDRNMLGRVVTLHFGCVAIIIRRTL